MNQLKKILVILSLFVLVFTLSGAAMEDLKIVQTQIKTISDDQGDVRVRVDWFARPGEMAITITYNGYLTQEGMVNMYLEVNGEERQFMTMKKEMKNRSQKLRIISFHPVQRIDGVNRLARIPDDSLVDSLLFRNAPYYEQFGDLHIELKFFCHGRWDGDGNNDDENYRFDFSSEIKGFAMNHF
jgi:hypothetical protein